MSPMQIVWFFFSMYKPRTCFFLLCCGAAVFLALKHRDALSRRVCRYIVAPAAVLFLLLINPLVSPVLVGYDISRAVRFFWLIPVAVLLAAVTVRLLGLLHGRWQKPAAVLAAVLVVLGFGGRFTNLRSFYLNRFINWYKVPEVVIALDDRIMADDTGLEKTAVFPWPLNMWVRQYRPEIVMPFSWNHLSGIDDTDLGLYLLFEETINPEPDAVIPPLDLDRLDALAVEGGYNYLVVDTGRACTGALHDFEEIGRIDTDPAQDTTDYDREYILYRRAEGGAL